jgi:hypothetical protein
MVAETPPNWVGRLEAAKTRTYEKGHRPALA